MKQKGINNWWSCDFETITDVDGNKRSGRVWLWVITNVADNSKFYTGTSIESFIHRLRTFKNPARCFFHNLKFDGSFILPALNEKGMIYNDNRKTLKKNEYSCRIVNNTWYSITFLNSNGKYIDINDSLKLCPFSVEQIAKKLNYPYKTSIDYIAYRPKDYKPTQREIDYCYRDTEIIAKMLKDFAERGIDKLTISSSAMSIFKNQKNCNYDVMFPSLENTEDSFLRNAYRGGFCYVNPEFANKEVGKGGVIDVNSLYPSCMRNCDMPVGELLYYTGENPFNNYLFVQHIKVIYELKKGFLPTLMKKSYMRTKIEYSTTSNGELEDLYLASPDLELFLKHYDIKYINYVDGYAFYSTSVYPDDCNPLVTYVDRFIKEKIEANKNGDMVTRQTSKLCMNSLYGKFASRLTGTHSIPNFSEEKMSFSESEDEELQKFYLPVAIFTTAWGRMKTISTAQKIYEMGKFLYSDTDSIHFLDLTVEDLKEIGIEIDKNELGKWDYETEFKRAKFIRQKTYIEETENGIQVHVCGMPKSCYDKVNFENFKIGSSYSGKLQQRRIHNGVELVETEFCINE